MEEATIVGYAWIMQSVVIPISLTAEQWLPFYQGLVQSVQATATDGRRIQLPARVLQPFVTPDGIIGVFRVRFDDRNRFVDIQMLSGPARLKGRRT